jgi:hypothetical protein
MVPVEGHYEQHCNALDAVRAGAALTSPAFDLDRFLAYLASYAPPPDDFRAWAESAPARFLAELEAAAGTAPCPVPAAWEAGFA